MALTWLPFTPWQLVATGLAGITALLLLGRGLFDGWRVFGESVLQRTAVLLTSLLALTLLAVAAWNPVLIHQPDPGKVHLAVVVDVSDSTLRVDGGWAFIQREAGDFLQLSLAKLPIEILEQGSASITTFRGNSVANDFPLSTLLSAFARLTPDEFAAGEGTDIGSGLERAAQQIEQAGGRGAILLISDGNDTVGNAVAAAEAISQRGIPVTVFPIEAGPPALAITSANLPRQTHADEDILLRGVVYNQTKADVRAQLTIAQNAGWEAAEGSTFGPSLKTSGDWNLAYGAYGRLRLPITFQGVGLQYVDVSLQDESGATTHQRRFFTHVNKPVELLGVGDTRWVQALSPDVINVTQIPPELLSGEDLSQYDGLVLSNVEAESLPSVMQNSIVQAVQEDGLGFMFINGDHQGADEEAPSILRSYHEMALDAILPVSTEPRPIEEEPPTRHAVILLDTSGSMNGWQLEKALEIVRYIVQEKLTRHDFLDIIILGPYHIVQEQQMHEVGKAAVLSQLTNVPRGSSDLKGAVELIKDRQLTNCGLIIISDGEIAGSPYRPECQTIVFAVNRSVPANSPLYDFAFPITVDQSFNPVSINVPFIEPESRDKFFELGTYTPFSLAATAAGISSLPVPDLELEGNAIAYPRSQATVIASRPKFVDPVLVYGESGNGYVGTFLTGFPETWLAAPEGQQALQEWLLQIVSYAARDRYDIQLVDNGHTLNLTITLQNEDNTIPRINNLLVTVEVGNDAYEVSMSQVPDSPATFTGVFQVPRGEEAQAAALVVEESGLDELARPQHIPLLLPPQGEVHAALTTEATSYGLNEALLQTIVETTGGQYHPADGAVFFHRSLPINPVHELWPWLLFIGSCFYLLTILSQRLNY